MESRSVKVLAVDDNQDNLIILKALLKEAFPEAAVFTALSGQQGLELAVKEEPDVILLDIVMPEMDGFKVCRRLKADKKLKDTPVVFVTANKADRESRILALKCGAEAFLAKPIDASELTAQISAMIKIKNANMEKRNEKERLAVLVEKQTHELTQAHVKAMELLGALNKENEARRKSEEALLEAQKIAHICSFEHDIASNKITWTEEGLNIYGVTHGSLLATPDLIHAYIHPEDRELVLRNTKKTLDGKSQFDFCFRIIRPDGEKRHVNLRSFPVFNETGKLIRVVGTVQDITEQKQAELMLKESEEKFRTYTKKAPLGIFISDSKVIILR